MFWTKWFKSSQMVCIVIECIANLIISIAVATLVGDVDGVLIGMGIFVLLTIICITLHSFLMMISEMSENIYAIAAQNGDFEAVKEELNEDWIDENALSPEHADFSISDDFEDNTGWFCICGHQNRSNVEICTACGRKNRRQ